MRERAWPRLASLRVRLTIAVALASAAGLTAASVVVVRAVETTVVQAIDDQNRLELEAIGDQLALGIPARAIHPGPGVPGRRISIVRPDGSRLDAMVPPDAPDPPPPPPRGFGVARPRWSVVDRAVVSPVDGPLRAIAESPLADVLRSTETLARVLAVGVPILVALLTLAAWLLIGRALRPVRVMTHQAANIADATAPERLAEPASRDELGELARTLNRMLDRLALATVRQREFVSDASHELRSPIAATRTQIEVALAHPERTDADTVLRGVLAETARLEALVADLLALARLDEQRTPLREELDLDDLLLEEAARSRPIAVDARGVTPTKLHGDRKTLGQLVRNLLDNAARHASSRVQLASYADAGAAVVTVDDDGPGVPDSERTRIFDRFTRLSPSRSRDDGGAGLGLALVHRVAEQHGGSVEVARSPLGGARFELRIPT